MRMGLHVNNPGRDDLVRRYVDEVRPSVVKFLHGSAGPDLMDYCRERGAKVVLRRVLGDGELKPGATGARVLRDRMLPMAQEYRNHIDYVEAANEEMQGRDDRREIDRLAALMLDFCREIDDRFGGQIKACVFNFSVGQPELDVWAREPVSQALSYAGRHGHAIGKHEYYKPRPWHGVQGDWQKWGQVWGWWMLRVVRDIAIWRELGIPRPGVIITESGRDDVPGTPGTGKGWRDEPRTPEGDFADFMQQYMRHLSHLPEIIGAVDFGFATSQPEKWGSFDLSQDTVMFQRVITTQRQLPIGHVGGGQAPPPPPPEGDLDQRLRDLGAANQKIQLNRNASLQQAIAAAGFWPTSPEFSFSHGGAMYTAQRAEHPGTGEMRVYYVRVPVWNDVKFVR